MAKPTSGTKAKPAPASAGRRSAARPTRSYSDGCANAHALELIGERWALLVIRELMLGPKRFKDLRAGLPGISPNVLSQRLEELEAASIVVRRRLPPPASVQAYDLSPWGRELEPAMQAIGRWAVRSPSKTLGPLSVNSLILSFRTMFDSALARGFHAHIALEVNGQWFHARIRKGTLDIAPGEPAQEGGAFDAILHGESNAIAGLVYGGQKLRRMIKAGALQAEGGLNVLERFATLFPLPEPAPGLVPAPPGGPS